MACKTVSVLGAATPQVAIPSRLPQTQSDWQTFTQQLNTLFSQLSTTARRPAATSVPIQYATLFSSTLPPLQTTNCTVTADNSWSLFGGFSYKIVVTGSNASVVCGASGFPLPIPPNENWLLSVYGKCSGASQSFKMGLQTATATYENTVITDATATTVDRFAIPLNLVADDASQCTLRLDFPSANGQTFWFDGFQYEPSVTGSINPSPFLSTNIIAGSIVAQFITVAQLSALSANMGTLTAGKIQSSDGRFTIDCTNELITITDGTNTRMQIGQVSAGVYDVKIWNGSGTLLFDAATGLQYAGNSAQVTQVIGNNSGNGQLNVNPTGGVTSNLPHANQSSQTLQVIANVGGNGQLNVSPTGGVTNTLPYANHAPSITTTIVNTPDGNGSYLGHGVVFQPHIHGNQIGWGHFVGDTSGDYVGNIADTTAKRFLHGAMSTGVQGVISPGSQVNVNPAGGVTGNLPYANHDVSVRTTLAPTVGGDGSYLNPGQVFNRHLNSASQSGLADDANAKMLRFGTLAGRPAAGTSGRIYHASDAGTNGVTYRDSGTAWIEVGVGHLADINGTTDNVTEGTNKFAAEHGADITGNHTSSDTAHLSGTPAATALGNANLGGHNLILDPLFLRTASGSDTTFWTNLNGSSITIGSGESANYKSLVFIANGTQLLSKERVSHPVQTGDVLTIQVRYQTSSTFNGSAFVSPFSNVGDYDQALTVTAGAWTTKTFVVPLTIAGTTSFQLVFYITSASTAGFLAVESVYCALNSGFGVTLPNLNKAYADFTDNTAGGHVGKTQSNVADDSNAKMLRFGTLASRPAAGTAGRIYHASDAGTNGITYRDTGSAWVGMAVGHLADINGTLDNTNDGSSRFAVAAVDPNKKALIDYSQPGHANANLQYFGGIQSGTCYDGQTITFNPVYSSIPLVIFPSGGMTYSSAVGSAASQSLAFTASSLTTSGFTASLKLVSGGTLTSRSDNFSTVTSGREYQATLTNAPAYNNTYTVNWSLASLSAGAIATVSIRETNTSGTLLYQNDYRPGQVGDKATNVVWSGATGTSVIDISVTVSGGTGTISASTVTFSSGTAPSTNSAVPSTAPIPWVAFPQT